MFLGGRCETEEQAEQHILDNPYFMWPMENPLDVLMLHIHMNFECYSWSLFGSSKTATDYFDDLMWNIQQRMSSHPR